MRLRRVVGLGEGDALRRLVAGMSRDGRIEEVGESMGERRGDEYRADIL